MLEFENHRVRSFVEEKKRLKENGERKEGMV